uniref:Uncharacterized protein n=1 Tax=Strigamia maritima TaxID=126957 RepID=T1JAG3_STRMM
MVLTDSELKSPIINSNSQNPTNYKSEYSVRYIPSYPLWIPTSKEPPGADLLNTDRQFLIYWKDSASHEYHTDPQLHEYERNVPCVCKDNITTFIHHKDPVFNKNTASTTYEDSFRMMPLSVIPKIEIPGSNIPFDNGEFYKIPQTSSMSEYTWRNYTNAENRARPFHNLKKFPSPIYKDDQFLWPKTETSEKFKNPMIYPQNKEMKSENRENHSRNSDDIIGRSGTDAAVPKSTYNYFYTVKPISKKEENYHPSASNIIITGDDRISYQQRRKSLVHQDFSCVQGVRASPREYCPFKLGHRNCGANYASTTASDDYPKHGVEKMAEIDPNWTHHVSQVVIGRAECGDMPTSTNNDMYQPWVRGDRCKRVYYPKWQLSDNKKAMDSATEFSAAYGNAAVYDVQRQSNFKDETHINCEHKKGVCDDGTTYKDHFKGHAASLPHNCNLFKQQDRSVKFPYFNQP